MALGLYSNLPPEACNILGSLPFLMMIYFSTTFSPGAGLPMVQNLRFLFARFYLWCMTPGYSELMQDCPPYEHLALYSALSGCLGLFLFLCAKAVLDRVVARRADSDVQARARIEEGAEFQALRREILKGRAGGAGGANLAKVTPQDVV
jgi:hypothetical protein